MVSGRYGGFRRDIMRIVVITTVILVLSLTLGCTITREYDAYYGKVIDAETREPIEGAAVLAVYYTEIYWIAGASSRFADAQETLTDKNGEFKIPAIRINKFRLLSGWDHYPQFTIFKPGYGCYPYHKDVKPMFVPNGTLPANQYVTIEFPKLKTKEERLENYGCYPSEQVPENKYSNLFQLIQQERMALGLEPRKMPK
jgi:hypothetical protein